ncbi:hypothetical protein BCR36DRAFT_407845 [Piromyces finnis]|uniref:Uncharacterized protein n=1 Tax=Piromyces finnis TaxID=1754191 RepID=A0A1Y1VNW7_9FUNG|nr:hypothetical protein BCR36DRAFT_407845 [Piromyces finnis]|eukprot:ORX60843.1 hypothetical protein BCR36DRAFT_407845 [Piromyces finnis]
MYITKNNEKDNLVVKEDESTFEDFDGDDTMENMLDLFIFHRKDAELMDWYSFLSFIIFLCVNVGCVSFNFYKALSIEPDDDNDMFTGGNNGNAMLNTLFSRGIGNITSILHSNNTTNNSIIIDKPTKILYITEFSVIITFGIIALYNYICLAFHPTSKSRLSDAANFTRLVREFSCFTLVPLFNINTIMGIYNDIAVTFKEEKKKYADRSKLWDGVWGISTKDVQKENASSFELMVESNSSEDLDMVQHNKNSNNNPKESLFKRFKHSKFFLHFVSVLIYIGFFLSIVALIALAFFAFIALYIKTRHVGNFIRGGNNIYKWFNFVTFIMNIASLSQQSPAIKLIIYQLKVLTRKAHHNEYRRRKQNRIKENASKFDADKNQEGIQPPKIIIHRKRISRTKDDTDLNNIDNDELKEMDTDKLTPCSLERRNSKLSAHSENSASSV